MDHNPTSCYQQHIPHTQPHLSSFSAAQHAPPSNMLVEDMNGPFSNSFAHEIIKSMDDGSLFNFDTGIECNFDNLDQLDESHNPHHAHNHGSSKTGDELELEYLKMSNKAINQPNQHHHHHNHHHHQQQQHSFNQPDAELIELFEYTSQFSMDDTINSNANLLAEHSGSQTQQNQSHLSNCGINEGSALMLDAGSSASTSPLDQTTQNKLDLTIQGHTINKPKWWSDNLIEPSLISSPAPPSSSSISSLLLSSSSRYAGTQEQDDECDSSGLFANNSGSGGAHIMQPLSNIIELKDFLFNNIESINVQTMNSIERDDAPSPPLSNASSSSLTLTASSFSADNFIAYPNLMSNLDENSENQSASANSSEQAVLLEAGAQPQQSQLQNTDDSSSCSSSGSSLPGAQANFKAYVALPPLNENKPARKRIYTHNKVNSLLHSNLTIIKAKTLTAANPANETAAAPGGGKVGKGAGKKAAKSSSLVVDKLNLSSPMKINLLTVVSGISNSKNFLKNCNLDDKTVIIDTTATTNNNNNNNGSSNSI